MIRPNGAMLRAAIRDGAHTGPTSGIGGDLVQANLVILPADDANDMRDLCARNPVPCPLLEELAPGAAEPHIARGGDVRTDFGAYRVWRDGELAERRRDIRDLWRDDLVAFLIGCSFSFEQALAQAGLVIRHQERPQGNVAMYHTNVRLLPAGKLHGTMVVSMRAFPEEQVARAREVTRPFRKTHGEPVHWGDPRAIGIADITRPDEGDFAPMHPGDVPVFWGCGVTPQLVAIHTRLPFVITHEPGYMLITDLTYDELPA